MTYFALLFYLFYSFLLPFDSNLFDLFLTKDNLDYFELPTLRPYLTRLKQEGRLIDSFSDGHPRIRDNREDRGDGLSKLEED